MLILDGGTGVRALGLQLAANGKPVSVDLLVSHTHWDHIQGLPFFLPFFSPGNAVRIWGARQASIDLEEILRNQMSPVVFPVPLDGLAAEIPHHTEQRGKELRVRPRQRARTRWGLRRTGVVAR